MNLCILDPADFLGGAELFTVDICPFFLQKNKVTLLHTGKCQAYEELLGVILQRKRQQQYSSNNPKQAGMTSGIILQVFDFPRLRPFRPFAFVKTLWKLSRFFQKNSFDAVQTNSVRVAILMGFLRFFGLHRKIRWVHIQHDFTFSRRLSFFLKKADKILTCSQIVLEDLEKKGISKDKMESVGNGILIPNLIPKPSQGEDQKKKRIAIIGRIDPWKGQQQFLRLAQFFPDFDFLIVGKSSEHDTKTQDFENNLRQQKRDYQIDNLSFLGFQNISELLPTLDLVLHLSFEKEPFGRVVLEALAYGIPVLASNRGGAREILTGDFLSSLLIDPEDTKEIAKKIKMVFQKKTFLDSYQDLARERAEHFSLPVLAQKIEQVLLGK